MSATNRGGERKPQDFYATPEWCIRGFLEAHPISHHKRILEPTAGNGNICRALREFMHPEATLTAVELRAEETEGLRVVADTVGIGDFRQFHPQEPFDLIITNPPYSIAREVIEHCFSISPEAEIIMLLRTAFLESRERFQFWQAHPADAVYVHAVRPSFTGTGTDSTAYGWIVWNSSSFKGIKVI